MPDIDPGTGIDLDLPYDDPAMTAIRAQLQASGKQLHGSRLADGDMRTVATQAMRAKGQNNPRAINAMIEAMTQDPGMWESIVAQQAPRLSQNAPETYQRVLGDPNERNAAQPQAQMRNEPPVSPTDIEERAEGPQALDDEAGEAPQNTGTQDAQGMGPWGPILAILASLAGGAGLVKGGQALRGRMGGQGAASAGPRTAMPDDIDAGAGMRTVTDADIMGPQPRQAVAGDIMQLFSPREAVDADFAPTAPVMRAEPQQGNKVSKQAPSEDAINQRRANLTDEQNVKRLNDKYDVKEKLVKDWRSKPKTPPTVAEAINDPDSANYKPPKTKPTPKPATKKGKGKADIARTLARRGRK